MGTLAEKLSCLANTKQAIRAAIEARGVPVDAAAPFREYPALIGSISGGDALPDKVFYYNNLEDAAYTAPGHRVVTVVWDSPAGITYPTPPYLSGKWVDAPAASGTDPDRDGCYFAFRVQRTTAAALENPEIAPDNGYESGCPGLTLGGWFYHDPSKHPAGYRCMFMDVKGAGAFGAYIKYSDHTKVGIRFAGVDYDDVYTITYNTWYHVALSFSQADNGNLTETLYINAVPVASKTGRYTIDFHTADIASTSTWNWAGYVKNVFASYGALTNEEIRQMMLRD